jgi:hypothetical protein
MLHPPGQQAGIHKSTNTPPLPRGLYNSNPYLHFCVTRTMSHNWITLVEVCPTYLYDTGTAIGWACEGRVNHRDLVSPAPLQFMTAAPGVAAKITKALPMPGRDRLISGPRYQSLAPMARLDAPYLINDHPHNLCLAKWMPLNPCGGNGSSPTTPACTTWGAGHTTSPAIAC